MTYVIFKGSKTPNQTLSLSLMEKTYGLKSVPQTGFRNKSPKPLLETFPNSLHETGSWNS
ncbi:hypothetical protein AUI06_00980 [archaeon 13_2_20CM_2_52_21]|nr:MAG: hypothetical protein AUI06_00980 [archaeon 13_2_20CM_2_52_21]